MYTDYINNDAPQGSIFSVRAHCGSTKLSDHLLEKS